MVPVRLVSPFHHREPCLHKVMFCFAPTSPPVHSCCFLGVAVPFAQLSASQLEQSGNERVRSFEGI